MAAVLYLTEHAAVSAHQPVFRVMFLLLQLLLEHSGILPELERSARDAQAKDLTRRQNRLNNMQALQRLAGRAATLQDDADLFSAMDDEADGYATGGRRADSSTGETSAGSTTCDDDGIMLLQRFVDLCSLQGDGEDGAEGKPRVQFMTMHASKGKEYDCVVLMSFYEGVLPSDRAFGKAELEQERNVAYVGVTRARDHLLITWPGAFSFQSKFDRCDDKGSYVTYHKNTYHKDTTVSRFLVKVCEQSVQGVRFTKLKRKTE